MVFKSQQPDQCLICNEENKTPVGKKEDGIFNCSTCSKRWRIEERPNGLLKGENLQRYTDVFINFLSSFDSRLDLSSLAQNALSILKAKFKIQNSGFVIYDQTNQNLRFINYLQGDRRLGIMNKLAVHFFNKSHPFVQCLITGIPIYYEIETHKKFYKVYTKITKAKYQVIIPIQYKKKPLGVFVFDFESEIEAKKKFHHTRIFKILADQIGIALNNTIIYKSAEKKYKQYVNLHASALSLNHIYNENMLDIIKEVLRSLASLVDMDNVLMLIYNHKFKVITIHKLIKHFDSTDISQTTLEVEDFEKYSILFSKAPPHVRFTENDSISKELGITGKQYLLMPSFEMEINEYSFLLGRNSQKMFTQDDVEVLIAFWELVKVTLTNLFLHNKKAVQDRLEKEIEIAKGIQKALLPAKMPEVKDYEFSGFMIPAREIGGDYYDIIGDDKEEMILAIGDVSGKGLPAGMLMVAVRTIIHSLARHTHKTTEILREINSYIIENNRNSSVFRFMSLILMKWKHGTHTFEYSGAGHGNILVYRKSEDRVESIFTGGTILGIAPDPKEYLFKDSIVLNVGDAILMYTDGATESFNIESEHFGEERLKAYFYKYIAENAENLLDKIYDEIKEFTIDTHQHDDTTFLFIRRLK